MLFGLIFTPESVIVKFESYHIGALKHNMCSERSEQTNDFIDPWKLKTNGFFPSESGKIYHSPACYTRNHTRNCLLRLPQISLYQLSQEAGKIYFVVKRIGELCSSNVIGRKVYTGRLI